MMETRMGEREAEALAIEYRPLGTLRKNPRNARTHAKKQVKAIAESIEAFGFTSPILIDEDGMILAGHGRFAAAKLLGLQAVPTIRKGDLSEAQKRAVVLAENQLAARAGWDQDMLVAELGDLAVLLPEAGFSIEVTGFEVGHVDCILSDAAEEVAASREDDLGPVPEKAVTQCGDAWIMGRHRIICGDARDAAVIRALLGDEVADMMITDPPYNVAIPGHAMGRGKVQHDNFAMACGEMSEDEFRDFLAQVLRLGAAVSRPGALHYVTMDWRHIADLIGVGKTVYDELLNLCVWVKSNPGQGSLYRSRHELVAVFKVGGADHVNNVELGKFGRNRSNVWHYAGATSFGAARERDLALHPTVKPVRMLMDAIRDVSKRAAIVLDLFGGSGTTLVAAERTGRRARLIEIEPRYVDVTIERFQSLTKADAVHAGSGKTFAEIAAERERA